VRRSSGDRDSIIGCVGAGWASDKAPPGASGSQIAQRSRVTIIAMAVSATCCVLTAVFFENIYAVNGDLVSVGNLHHRPIPRSFLQ